MRDYQTQTQIKVLLHYFYCCHSFLSHSWVFQTIFKYLLKKQISLFLTVIAENKTKNDKYIYNSFIYTKSSHSVICKIFYLFVLFIKKTKTKKNYRYIRKRDNFDQFHMNVNCNNIKTNRRGSSYCFSLGKRVSQSGHIVQRNLFFLAQQRR